MNKEPTCDFTFHHCVLGQPCPKYDNPLSCPYYKQLKKDGRLSLARRDGQVVLE